MNVLNSSTPSSKRLAFIDSSRGFASIYVLIFHVGGAPALKTFVPNLLKPLITYGSTGVTLFFIISGFTLCYSMESIFGEKGYLKKFYLRRIARIVPLFYILLFACSILRWGSSGILNHIKDIGINATFIFSFIPGHQNGIVPASWTLSIEMIFYFLFPLIFKYVHTIKKSLIATAIGIVISLIHMMIFYKIPDYKFYFSIFQHLPFFGFGIILFFVHKRYCGTLKERTAVVLIASGIIGTIILTYLDLPVLRMYLTSTFYCMVLLGLSVAPLKIFVNRLTIFMGMISYSVYLFHTLVMSAIVPRLPVSLVAYAGQAIAFICCILAVLIPTVLISYVAYRIIEKPFIEYTRSLGS